MRALSEMFPGKNRTAFVLEKKTLPLEPPEADNDVLHHFESYLPVAVSLSAFSVDEYEKLLTENEKVKKEAKIYQRIDSIVQACSLAETAVRECDGQKGVDFDQRPQHVVISKRECTGEYHNDVFDAVDRLEKPSVGFHHSRKGEKEIFARTTNAKFQHAERETVVYNHKKHTVTYLQEFGGP